MKLLHIDSSILGPNSVSRILSAEIVQQQRRLYADLEVVYHDLAADPALHLSAAHIAVWHTGATADDIIVQQDLAAGEKSLEELFAADIIVIGAPSQLKSWIDRLIVSGRSFRYTASGPQSLLPPGKKLFIASTRGGAYGPDSPASSLDHQESYLRAALGFIGLTDVTIIRAENVATGQAARDEALAAARKDIAEIAA